MISESVSWRGPLSLPRRLDEVPYGEGDDDEDDDDDDMDEEDRFMCVWCVCSVCLRLDYL